MNEATQKENLPLDMNGSESIDKDTNVSEETKTEPAKQDSVKSGESSQNTQTNRPGHGRFMTREEKAKYNQ